MKKKRNFIVAGALLCGIILGACSSDETSGSEEKEGSKGTEFVSEVQLGTGSTGGTYFPLGQEMVNVMNGNVDYPDFNASAVATGASVENLGGIYQGSMQLGMSVNITAVEALTGAGDFDGVKIDNFGFMGQIYPEVMQVVTTKDSGITSIDQLKGKKVAIGPAGSGTQAAAKLILEAYGLKDGDYQAFEEGFGDASARLQDGQLDASFGLLGLPASGIEELSYQRDVVILPVEGEALESIVGDTDYGQIEIQADVYEFLEEPVNTITAYAVLVGSTTQISEELGYEIVKGLYENSDQITHPQGAYLTLENIMNGSEGLPIHPGAKKYFEEKGISVE